MKLVTDEKDQKIIDAINADIEEKGFDSVPLFVCDTTKTYKISFECADIAKANRFIALLLSNKDESNEFMETAGIKVLALHYDDNKSDIIQILEDTIARLKKEVI